MTVSSASSSSPMSSLMSGTGTGTCVGSFRLNSGEDDVSTAARYALRAMRFSDADFTAQLRPSTPLFTGCSAQGTRRHAAHLARLVPADAPQVPYDKHVDTPVCYYGASTALHAMRARRIPDMQPGFGKRACQGFVFSGSNAQAYEARLCRFDDC